MNLDLDCDNSVRQLMLINHHQTTDLCWSMMNNNCFCCDQTQKYFPGYSWQSWRGSSSSWSAASRRGTNQYFRFLHLDTCIGIDNWLSSEPEIVEKEGDNSWWCCLSCVYYYVVVDETGVSERLRSVWKCFPGIQSSLSSISPVTSTSTNNQNIFNQTLLLGE